MSPPTVCYILAAGRSGSTLLGRILGQADGCCDVGELSGLWRVRRFDDWRCGCGELLDRCPFWSDVLSAPIPGRPGTLGAVDGATVAELRRTSFRTRHVPALWWRTAVLHRPAAPGYAALLGPLYRSVARVSGATLLVDSSKFPAEAVIARRLDQVDLRVVHLVRDPRAVAYSWQRTRPRPSGSGGDRTMVRRHPTAVAGQWAGVNALGATFVRHAVGADRYRRLRYEDLVAEPEAVCSDLLAFLGLPGATLPFTDPATVALAPTHNVTGNPERFRTGPVPVVLDDEWRTAMGRGDRRRATLAAAPVLAAMGYRVIGRGP